MKAHSPDFERRCCAFTLIELLVALAIVGILVAIAGPGLTKIRKNFNQAGCVSNLRQIGTAWHLYLADNNRTFPTFATHEMYFWGGGKGSSGGSLKVPMEQRPLYPYLPDEKVFRCPSDVATDKRGTIYSMTGNSYAMAYSRQRGILSVPPEKNGSKDGVPGVYDRLEKPSATILVFDHSVRASEKGYSDPNALYYRDNWHPNDVSNILMADGHVETFERAVLDASPHALNPPGYTWGWNNYPSGGQW